MMGDGKSVRPVTEIRKNPGYTVVPVAAAHVFFSSFLFQAVLRPAARRRISGKKFSEREPKKYFCVTVHGKIFGGKYFSDAGLWCGFFDVFLREAVVDVLCLVRERVAELRPVLCCGQQFFFGKRPEVPEDGYGGEGKMLGKFLSGGGRMLRDHLQYFS